MHFYMGCNQRFASSKRVFKNNANHWQMPAVSLVQWGFKPL